ncbi:PQQ-dependent sugar dehydrogenase [Solemya pervernicosa gill symbiont]|uniref:PQQ-dependent sugar dehydrogenase n=1 Tax=Solemya pervernicosa gill symbiont TaxID=642797 RepID=UPI001F20EFA1|nr:PQQ-dependent sugar dehydrogenase [Solemya pervernicosa gill symbiont]
MKNGFAIIGGLLLLVIGLQAVAATDEKIEVVTVASGLEHPWGMAFLPDGRVLITERPGRLRIIEGGRLIPKAVTGLPQIAAVGQGGLLDVAIHPNYLENGWIYLSFSAEGKGGLGTEVVRGRLRGMQLVDVETIFKVEKKSSGGRHFGSRLLFDRKGYLYITSGERGDRPRAQDLDDHAGSVIRLYDDGRTPVDNPYVNRPGTKPEIYSYGHRNPQGMTLHPETGEVWTHEHGPQGGDEINIIEPGRNYGWPVITYGVNYGWGTKIGEGTQKVGMEQPLYYWDPSIAPSGMSFYSGDQFPQWRGNLFVGALKYQLLVRLELDGDRVIKEHRLLKEKLGRIRDVREGHDGYLYLLTDEGNGRLVRLEPSQ